MFNAPEIIMGIPDIAQIYEVNEQQCIDLDNALETMDQNIFFDGLDEQTAARWEKILGIVPLDNDTLDERRFRIHAAATDHTPYPLRAIIRKISNLCPDGFAFLVSDDRTDVSVELGLKSKKMREDVERVMEEILPLNMLFAVSILYNQYQTYNHKRTYGQMGAYTHSELRENVME